ncbi:SDR family oxidoreductase [Enterovirga sp. CN4-39]|uniref:SDR family oxidoreductase n=1 Tax=Enterovirga sp. CN4-39 TaxID=3400910 RepID=UPI003C0DC5A3
MQRDGSGVVMVTGASAGIGRAVATAFGEMGWSVGLLARGRDRLESAAREVERAGGRALVLQADVANPDDVEEAADRLVAAFGGLDMWVNNAMATIYAPVVELTPAEIRRVTDVTYLGQVHGTLAALRLMRPADRGTIVQVGSALAYRSIPLQSAYCAAKAAVRGFTDSLRSELLHEKSGIRLTMVQLPAVDTPQFDWARSRLPRALQPVPPIHEPHGIAQEIVRAAIEAPRELWIGKPAIEAILGTMVAPSLMDRMMARRAWPGQMTEEPAKPRPDNLFDAPPGDPGAAGRFGAHATARGVSETAVRAGLGLACTVALAGVSALAFRLGQRRSKALLRLGRDRH